MQNIYVIVEDGNKDAIVDGRYEFATVPRIGEYITIGSLGREAFFRVTAVINHATDNGDSLQPLQRIEIKAEVVK